MTQYFSPSVNENKMREDLPKFEDFKFFQDELVPHPEVQKLKLAQILLNISGFFHRCFTLFK